jgi:serine/threonine-protein kinase RsbT
MTQPSRAAFAEIGERLLRTLEERVHLVNAHLRERIVTLPLHTGEPESLESVSTDVVKHVTLFGGNDALEILRDLDAATGGVLSLFPRDKVVPIEHESAIVEARRAAGAVATRLGFRAVQWTKIVTATSELARNINMYAGKGEVEIRVLLAPRKGMSVLARDRGPGIPNITSVLEGKIASKRGMGMGLRGVKAMADAFEIRSEPGLGTHVKAVFYLAPAFS